MAQTDCTPHAAACASVIRRLPAAARGPTAARTHRWTCSSKQQQWGQHHINHDKAITAHSTSIQQQATAASPPDSRLRIVCRGAEASAGGAADHRRGVAIGPHGGAVAIARVAAAAGGQVCAEDASTGDSGAGGVARVGGDVCEPLREVGGVCAGGGKEVDLRLGGGQVGLQILHKAARACNGVVVWGVRGGGGGGWCVGCGGRAEGKGLCRMVRTRNTVESQRGQASTGAVVDPSTLQHTLPALPCPASPPPLPRPAPTHRGRGASPCGRGGRRGAGSPPPARARGGSSGRGPPR